MKILFLIFIIFNMSFSREEISYKNFETAIIKTMGKQTNKQKNTFISSERRETPYAQGDYYIIRVNTNSNLTNKMVISGAKRKAKAFFEEINTNSNFKNAEKIALIFQIDVLDKFGNLSKIDGIEILLSRETIKKINWKNFLPENFESIADNYFEHPLLTK